ncbi:cytochrome c [Desulfoluna sp.]|uniref:c-type cytochrome n=1 Tax=Desulfoluna sp. TaxID=2045199 RepID=UPI00261ACD82|nr:cytochrome c [Desulfoluna sp.]
MNILRRIRGTAVLLLIGSIALTGCAKPGQTNEEAPHSTYQKLPSHEEAMGGHHDAEPLSHAEDPHMQHMQEVKIWLQKELGHTYDLPLPPATNEQLTAGRKIYLQSCAPCHGEKGRGDGPVSESLEQKPSDFTATKHTKFYSEQGRLHIIKKGIEGTPMAGWENALNEAQLQGVYAYIRSLSPFEPAGAHHHH